MRILVFMSDNRPVNVSKEIFDYCDSIDCDAYHSLSCAINYEYCKKYRYDFKYYRPYYKIEDSFDLNNCIDPNTEIMRHCAWCKLLSTINACNTKQYVSDTNNYELYDYVVYIDSDCIFKNIDISLESIIESHPDKNFIFFNNKPWGDDKPCSGFFICKNNDDTYRYLKEWFFFNFDDIPNPCRFEQGALWYLFNDFNIAIIDEWTFHEDTGQFLRHICTNDKDQRIHYFKHFILDNNIDINNNNLEVIQTMYEAYDTSVHSIFSEMGNL